MLLEIPVTFPFNISALFWIAFSSVKFSAVSDTLDFKNVAF